MTTTTHNDAAIRDALALIVAPGQVVEIRVPNVGGRKTNTASGYFDDLDKAAQGAARYNGRDTVYASLQRINPALLARYYNRMQEYATYTTTDADATARRWLPVDCDPPRPAGISSTNDEHDAGLQRAFQIRAALRVKGWPEPVYADSGNGGHLLYRVDLPADDGSLTNRILKVLAAQFNDDIVKIDETVYNAGRVWKVYGTHAAKGDSIPGRPHRLARILEAPDVLTVVPVALLEALAGGAPNKETPTTNDQPQPAKRRVDVFDVEDYLRKHGVAFSDPVSYRDGKKWMLDACVWAGHTDRSAVVWQTADGIIHANCNHNSCEGKGWIDLREHFEPGYRAQKEENERAFQARQRETQPGDASEVGNPPIDRRLNEVANATRFVRQHGKSIRYCKTLASWFVWDTTRWVPDTRGVVMELAKATAASIYHEAATAPEAMRDQVAKWAHRSHFRAGLTAMVALAESNPAVAILATDLDSDRWALNCLNGTLNLRTGQLRPHDPADLLTKQCPVTYDAEATLPLWDTFLSETTGGDEDFAGFLQRIAGYTLQGDPSEEVIVFPHGPGATGKSTFLEAFKAALGDYALTADFEAFLKKSGDGGIRTDIARLAAARFVVSIEVDEGKKLAEGLVKTITGGDTVTARHLYQKSFEYRPDFTLWLAANHAPKVNADDDAMWRRILRLPFTHVVPKVKRDPKVKAVLRDPAIAGAAILAWAVRGCLEWQRDGLNVPVVVENATETYRREMNPLSDWVDEYCDLSPQAWTATNRLWSSYQAYAQSDRLGGAYRVATREEGQRATATKKVFAEHLKVLGCAAELRRADGKPTRGWRGIAFKEDDTPRGGALPIDPEADPPVTDIPPCGNALDTSEPLHDGGVPLQPFQPLHDENPGGDRENPALTPVPVTDVTDRNGNVGNFGLCSPHKEKLPKQPLHPLQPLQREQEPCMTGLAGQACTPHVDAPDQPDVASGAKPTNGLTPWPNGVPRHPLADTTSRDAGDLPPRVAFDADDLPDRVALRQWAEDEARGAENPTFTEAAIREATRRYYALTIPPVVPRDEMAKVIRAAMKGH